MSIKNLCSCVICKKVKNRDKIKTKLLIKAGWCVKVFEDRHYTPIQAFNELTTL